MKIGSLENFDDLASLENLRSWLLANVCRRNTDYDFSLEIIKPQKLVLQHSLHVLFLKNIYFKH